MDAQEELSGSGVTFKGCDAPHSFRVESRVDSSGQFGGSTAPSTPAAPVGLAPPNSETKKKRGRPRKYAGDGAIVALSPMPISASIPLSGEFAGWKHSAGHLKKKHKLELKNGGKSIAPHAGGDFIPHMITVNPGEDIMMKIISFSQQGSRAICILAANGSISNVTLHQPNSSGGTLTYEGRFEILSLTGSFMPTDDNGLTKSRSGRMSVSLAGPDGRVLGGGLAGMLVAACPVQVVIGSFLPGNEHEEKPKKPKFDHTISFTTPTPSNPISEERHKAAYSGSNPVLTPSSSFHGDNVAPGNSILGPKISDVEHNILLPGEDT